MEYTFKTANEAFTILYDDLGRKDKDDQYYNIVFLSNDLYNRINKPLLIITRHNVI